MTLRRIDVTQQDRHAGPKDEPPGLAWIEISSLRINEAYQRPIEHRGWKTIRAIASSFSWSRFGALDVTEAEHGEYDIIDGQHRTHAAAMCGIEAVPCLVKSLTDQEAAAAFAAINGTVTALTPNQVYRAALAALEPWAVQCDAVAKQAGLKLMAYNKSSNMKLPGEIFCINAFRGLVEDGAAQHLIAAMKGVLSHECYSDSFWYSSVPLVALTRAAQECGVVRPEHMAQFLGECDLWDIYDRVMRLKLDRHSEFSALSTVKLLTNSITAYLRAWQNSEVAA